MQSVTSFLPASLSLSLALSPSLFVTSLGGLPRLWKSRGNVVVPHSKQPVSQLSSYLGTLTHVRTECPTARKSGNTQQRRNRRARRSNKLGAFERRNQRIVPKQLQLQAIAHEPTRAPGAATQTLLHVRKTRWRQVSVPF